MRSGNQPRPTGEAGPITILLVDDHNLVREGLRSLLEAEAEFHVLGEARDGYQALELAVALDPDVVVMDIAMPQMNGIEATRQLRKMAPRSRVLILSAHAEIPYVERVASLGAIGFVLKDAPVSDLFAGIRAASLDRTFVSPVLRRWMKPVDLGATRRDPTHSKLTPREAQVLQLVSEGAGNKGIAGRLRISIKTVEKHRQSLMRKLDLHDVAGVVRYALSEGIIEDGVQVAPDEARRL